MNPFSVVALPAGGGVDGELAAFVDMIRPDFLAEAGWDAKRQVLSPPQDHPVIGWLVCRVDGCGAPTMYSSRICMSCTGRLRRSRLAVEDFVRLRRPEGPVGYVAPCRVPGCGRPWLTFGRQLCAHHYYLRERDFGADFPLERFIVHPEVKPLPGFGPCQVVACERDACSDLHGHCHMHRVRWTKRLKRGGADDVAHFNRTEPPTAEEGEANLRGLAPLVVAQLLYGLQRRVDQGCRPDTGRSARSPTYCGTTRSPRSPSPWPSRPTPWPAMC
jgi:hypothetical protein